MTRLYYLTTKIGQEEYSNDPVNWLFDHEQVAKLVAYSADPNQAELDLNSMVTFFWQLILQVNIHALQHWLHSTVMEGEFLMNLTWKNIVDYKEFAEMPVTKEMRQQIY